MTMSICPELLSAVSEVCSYRFHHRSAEVRSLGIPPRVPITDRRSYNVFEIPQYLPRF
ncbi:hypothetical protein AGR6A_Lc80018 [Agrobacterium sp. NCPPB 925]|nr:hypothetical protein AGR6A_Lc80018 [Agrobacterium sp. NCPPB 925]